MSQNGAEAVISERGCVMLQIPSPADTELKFKFKRCRVLASGESSWRCSTSGCTASVRTMGPNYSITDINNTHNHEPLTKIQQETQVLSASAKRKAVEMLSERPSEVLRSLITPNHVQTLETNILRNIKKNMYNARRKSQPSPSSSAPGQRLLEVPQRHDYLDPKVLRNGFLSPDQPHSFPSNFSLA
ncbi:hypothetical protein GE061_005625 [Apolygus lucorum]|uniref:Uncharacterized protein n=1 Tax=Apolygus lucorum TaxID=248454 RepID=A0A6A4IU92_APOLU|nr:hypothetical protein GE061_005625 [Apolygus lucorum]